MDAPSPVPTFTVQAVGVVRSPRAEALDDDWGEVESSIELLAPYDERSIAGLAAFSHVEVVFVFDRVDADHVQRHARRPRANPAWPEVGIFAQRAKRRPNRIGTSTCQLVQVAGSTIVVRGLDAIDGTPVVDIKPYFAEFAPRTPVHQPDWSHELMAAYF